MPNRSLSLLAATLAALAIGAAPALAGENDDDDDDEAVAVQTMPAPAEASAAAPRGGVATGLGGTAPDGPGAALVGGLVYAGLVAAAGGAVALRQRREAPQN